MRTTCSTNGPRNCEGKTNCNLRQRFAASVSRCVNWFRSCFTRRTQVWALAAWLALGAGAGHVPAQDRNGLTAMLVTMKVVPLADGQERLVHAREVRPGETLHYVATYRNAFASGIRELQPVLPIPAGMQYVAGSATPQPTHASLDGRVFAPLPLKRLVKLADGSTREELVPAAEYRALRWSLGDLAAGASTNVTARARLLLPGETAAK
ncbi:MAG: hypothetical protein ABMA26_12540 [Limisphaerales bacterium]